jgi:aminoglycoside phosphotransferase (APT) family kinase protein
MSETRAVRQVCALLHDGRVLTDDAGRLPSFDDPDGYASLARRARTCGDPAAVPVAPQLQLSSEPPAMLSVFVSRGDVRVDGHWTPVEAVAEDEQIRTCLDEVVAVLTSAAPPPANRPEWFRTASWYPDVDTWIDGSLEPHGSRRTGPSEVVKAWSLSAVLRVPCDPAPVWFKASCRHFHAEPALTELVAFIAPEQAPTVVAADHDRGWLLLEQMDGALDDEDDGVPHGAGVAAAAAAATLQVKALEHLDEITATGLPVRGPVETLQSFDLVLRESRELDQLTDEELAAVRACRDEVHSMVGELAGCSLPIGLVHGDLHPGNAAYAGDSVVLYDWSDACLGHPFLDLVLLSSRVEESERAATREAFAAPWRAAFPGLELDLDRVVRLATVLEAAFQTVTYEQIYRSQEPASLWEFRGAVARRLRELPAKVAEAR